MVKRLVLELDEEMHKRFKQYAISCGKSMREILTELLNKKLRGATK